MEKSMNRIKELILVIQVIAGAGAMARIVYYIITSLNEDDHTARNKKIKNVFIALILIETVFTVANIIKSYYQ